LIDRSQDRYFLLMVLVLALLCGEMLIVQWLS
jgi:hypothetical protein